MEISQSELFVLLIHSAVGGAILGLLYDLMRAARMIVKAALTSKETVLSRPLEKNAQKSLLADGKDLNGFSRVACWLVTFMTDVFFMITSAVTVIMIAYACNSGRMRWMLLIGHAIGFVLYRNTIGKVTTRFFAIVILAIRKLMLKICNAVEKMTKCLIIKIKGKKKRGRHCEKY